MQLLDGQLIKADLNVNSRGGTELIAERMVQSIDQSILQGFQIVFSRVKFDLQDNKIRILYCHDLPDDPESACLANNGWENFEKIVFVSYWQMNQYIAKFNIPHSKCVVLLNSILPFDNNIADRKTRTGPVVLGYWSTPHRGLEILVPVFELLAEQYDVELRVFSSFDLYGWPQRDGPYEQLFERCRQHPKIEYSRSVDNQQLRAQLYDIDIMAYPSIWPETSCLCLMEAMSAGVVPVHSSLAALPETAANWTMMYQYDEQPNNHASTFYHMLKFAVENIRTVENVARITGQKNYADTFYSWNIRQMQWEGLLKSLSRATVYPVKRAEPLWTYTTT